MRLRLMLPFASSLWLLAAPLSAQRTIAYDTLAGESPVAVTCGFCAGEKLGVVFRDLPAPAVGLNPEDFPIQLEGLQIAVASADAVGSGATFTCSGSTEAGEASVGIAIYAGETLATDITSLPADAPWPGETLVWAEPDVPVERSVADAAGSATYEVSFNRLLLEDAAGLPFRVEPPNVYVRVVVTLNSDTVLSSASCESLMLETPSAFGVRDNDDVIANQRNFIFADGLGWLWNEDVPGGGISGDWALRLEIIAEGSPGMADGGTTTPDAGPEDTGAPMADAGLDSGVEVEDGGCAASGAPVSNGTPLAVAALLLLALRRGRGL